MLSYVETTNSAIAIEVSTCSHPVVPLKIFTTELLGKYKSEETPIILEPECDSYVESGYMHARLILSKF